MTVAELITQLSTLPPTLPVVLQLGKNELGNGREVGRVEVLTGNMDESGQWFDCGWFVDHLVDGDGHATEIVNLTNSPII